jgi:hypothetical protein
MQIVIAEVDENRKHKGHLEMFPKRTDNEKSSNFPLDSHENWSTFGEKIYVDGEKLTNSKSILWQRQLRLIELIVGRPWKCGFDTLWYSLAAS